MYLTKKTTEGCLRPEILFCFSRYIVPGFIGYYQSPSPAASTGRLFCCAALLAHSCRQKFYGRAYMGRADMTRGRGGRGSRSYIYPQATADSRVLASKLLDIFKTFQVNFNGTVPEIG
jgi:hypothetical protein